jgi:hypothetical protein
MASGSYMHQAALYSHDDCHYLHLFCSVSVVVLNKIVFLTIGALFITEVFVFIPFQVDLEHNHYRSFQGLTCLMQISTRTEDFIVDTLKLRNYLGEYLREPFQDATKRKVQDTHSISVLFHV